MYNVLRKLSERDRTYKQSHEITHWHGSKGDDENLWEREKFNPPPATQIPLHRWSPKFAQMTISGISATVPNFVGIGLRVSYLRMRDF